MFKERQCVQILGYFHDPCVEAVVLEDQKLFDLTIYVRTQDAYDLYIPVYFVHPIERDNDQG